MLVVRANAGFPAPAAFTFFAIGIGHSHLKFLRLTFAQGQLRYVDKFAQVFLMRLANLKLTTGASEGHAGLEPLADALGLPRLFQHRQGAFADGKQGLPVGRLVGTDAELKRFPVGQVHTATVEMRDGLPRLVGCKDEHWRKHLGE